MSSEAIPVSQLMTSSVISAGPDTTVEEAADTLLAEEIGSLVVLEDGELVGVVTSTDLVEMVSAGAVEPGATVAQYMTEDVVTVAPDDSIQDAAARMITDGIEHLPVVDADGGVVGMLSTTDLTTYLSYKEGSGA